MAYYYTKFGNIAIPDDEQSTTFQKQIKDGTIIALPNGSFYSAYQNTPLAPADVSVSFNLVRNTEQELLNAYMEWESALLAEQEGMLRRKPNSDQDETQSCLAKYKSISATPPVHKTSTIMQVTIVFTLLNDRWQGLNTLTDEKTFTLGSSGSTLTFLADKGKGNAEINNVQFFLSLNSGTLTKVMLQPENGSRSFSYDLPLTSGDKLSIDDREDSVIKNFTEDAYAGTSQTFATDQRASSAWAPFTRNGALKVRLWGAQGSTGYVTIHYYRTYA